MTDETLAELYDEMRSYVAEGGRVVDAWNAGYALGQHEARTRCEALETALTDVLHEMREALSDPDLRRQHIETGVKIAERALVIKCPFCEGTIFDRDDTCLTIDTVEPIYYRDYTCRSCHQVFTVKSDDEHLVLAIIVGHQPGGFYEDGTGIDSD